MGFSRQEYWSGLHVKVTCKYCGNRYKGLGHPWILVSTEGSWNKSLADTKGWCVYKQFNCFQEVVFLYNFEQDPELPWYCDMFSRRNQKEDSWAPSVSAAACGERGLLGIVNYSLDSLFEGFPGDPDGKESACNGGDSGLIPGSGRSPGEGNGYPFHSWRIPGQRSLGGYNSWGHNKSDTTERLTLSHFLRKYLWAQEANEAKYSGNNMVWIFRLELEFWYYYSVAVWLRRWVTQPLWDPTSSTHKWKHESQFFIGDVRTMWGHTCRIPGTKSCQTRTTQKVAATVITIKLFLSKLTWNWQRKMASSNCSEPQNSYLMTSTTAQGPQVIHSWTLCPDTVVGRRGFMIANVPGCWIQLFFPTRRKKQSINYMQLLLPSPVSFLKLPLLKMQEQGKTVHVEGDPWMNGASPGRP